MSIAVDRGNHGALMPRYVEIDIRAVHESKHNPRRHFDEAKLQELSANIAKVGIITPLIVRPAPDSIPKQPQYEIAAGHRRYRAAKLAKLTLLPCLVREMSDQEFMELLNIENLQREGLHPLDEAKGYAMLMAAPYRMDVQTIADKVGRSVTYVYDRVKLVELVKEAQELFWADRITAGHAIVLARLSPDDQARAIEGGLMEEEHGLYDPNRPTEGKWDGFKAVSVRELQAWVDKNVRFDAVKAEPLLFPETVQAVQATMQEGQTFIPITHDHHVRPEAKEEGVRTYGPMSWKRADGEAGSKVCDHAVMGVIVVGLGRGEAFPVCIQKKKCVVHWKDEAKAAQAKEKGGVESPAAKAAEAKAAKARQKERERQERTEQRRKHWTTMLPKIEAAVLAQVQAMPVSATGPLADILVKAVSRWDRSKLSFPRGTSAEDLVRYLAAKALAGDMRNWDASDTFPAVAKALGVDLSPFVKLDKAKKGTGA